MTDDEAFIRAIVDAPGDDAPRLVYADWLDERGDPRGAYLRAEADQPGESRSLGPTAATLDPLWVARLSRPPVGVCCDHVRFCDRGPELIDYLNRGPEVDNDDMNRVEARLGAPLPVQYRAFLLNYNGGRTKLRCEVRLPAEGPDRWWIDRFCSVYPPDIRPLSLSPVADLEEVTDRLREIEGPHLDGYLPIAALNHDDYLLIRHDREATGTVFVLFTQTISVIARVSESLGDFLDWIEELDTRSV